MTRTVDVLLPLPIDQLFSYAIEENTEILLGDYVVVPFGKKRLIGIVWKYSDKSGRALKFIEQKIDLPNIRPKLITFCRVGCAIQLNTYWYACQSDNGRSVKSKPNR